MTQSHSHSDIMESGPLVLDAVESACKKIPPLWPLKHFVAVNPFVGLSHLKFSDAVRLVHRVAHGDMTLPATAYAEAFARGEITADDLSNAIRLHRGTWTADELGVALAAPWESESVRLSVADILDRKTGSRWDSFVVEEVSKWCASYFDEGQALWRMPWTSLPLFRAWKRGVAYDRTAEVAGVPGFRSTIATLPDDAPLAIQIILEKLGLPQTCWDEFLHRQLMSVRGWAGYVQYQVREKAMRGTQDDSLVQLLAIRLAYDFALHDAFGPCPEILLEGQPRNLRVPALVVWQDALEIAHRRGLISQLLGASAAVPVPSEMSRRKAFQAVFCIDVRSEIFRRALESASSGAETIGFAGFFGFAIEVIPLNHRKGAARCPVLLVPSHRIAEAGPKGSPVEERAHVRKLARAESFAGVWKSFKTATVTCFPFVESLGLAYSAPLLRDSLALPTQQKPPAARYRVCQETGGCSDAEGISFADRLALAEGALRNMGLTQNFARLVLICGHGSKTANNPFASSLDCGACGGHAGDANARVAVVVLNDANVQSALISKGIEIPQDTVFVAAIHNTTTDEVELLDTDAIPSSHHEDVSALRQALAAAGVLAREERAETLGLSPVSSEGLKAAIEQRSRNWAEVRPEWGLAGNYAFIAAPRSRTSNLRLDGRAFLHNYDHTVDPGNGILELILCAPMVVANWINLQYFGSSANNALFGSGNKVLHNVVGKLGVLEGNGGDLRSGLPFQSVHNGTELVHLPLRLNVIIEAPTDRIDSVLAKHTGVRELVENQWLHLHALENDGKRLLARADDGEWISVF